jgi:hypothetical protein
MATIIVIELEHWRRWEIERDPFLFANFVIRLLRQGGFANESLPGGRVIFTGHASDPIAGIWKEFAETFLHNTENKGGVPPEQALTILELNHNSWTEVEKNVNAFINAILQRMKSGSGSKEWTIGGRIMFTGPSNKEPAVSWRQFAESQLMK